MMLLLLLFCFVIIIAVAVDVAVGFNFFVSFKVAVEVFVSGLIVFVGANVIMVDSVITIVIVSVAVDFI